MTEYAESPFQMDEELVSDGPMLATEGHFLGTNGVNPSTALLLPLMVPRQQISETLTSSDCQILLDPEIQVARKLQARLGYLKTEEGAGTTTEEDEMTYEEDADDRFDKHAAARLNAEFKALQATMQTIPLTPPENFAPVINNIYRSSFPQAQNFPFLKKLRLRSVLCLIPEEYPESHEEFFHQEGIRLFQLGMAGNKEPFVKISADLVTEAMKVLLNPENHPILIHCNRGKHRTGCLVGALRRLQGWSLTIIFDEYRKFAAPKERSMDQQFIELYDQTDILRYANENKYLPLPWD